ncbi:glycosyltransferase [Chromohalobacter sp. 48-RD10]|uniref:glycosyltransferase family 2 protein n=1 Tax=Chromohalobacter sp. 48-RD10 TaxID=2994063 RepID=UPI0024695A51|nr:glycosyltransferase [Chromohalobacter sp. 48-RD10]
MKKISLVTPLKDEIDNILVLLEAVKSQTISIQNWVVVENGSTDGSKELLDEISTLTNVKNFKVVSFVLPSEKYELGGKYATVVSVGISYLLENNLMSETDYLGILDADCTPPPNYYEDLVRFLESDAALGISSGQAYHLDGSYDGKNSNWPRGNCRLWKRECFISSGYIIGPSADALSVCKAELKGWKCYASKDLFYVCREVGKKVDYSYYGYSAYYRGIPIHFSILKSINYMLIGKFSNGASYFKGYICSFLRRKDRVADIDIIRYNKRILWRRVNEKLFG